MTFSLITRIKTKKKLDVIALKNSKTPDRLETANIVAEKTKTNSTSGHFRRYILIKTIGSTIKKKNIKQTHISIGLYSSAYGMVSYILYTNIYIYINITADHTQQHAKK